MSLPARAALGNILRRSLPPVNKRVRVRLRDAGSDPTRLIARRFVPLFGDKPPCRWVIVTKLQRAQPFPQLVTVRLGFLFDSRRPVGRKWTLHGAPHLALMKCPSPGRLRQRLGLFMKWVQAINNALCAPAVATEMGGCNYGGAVLTPIGTQIVDRYRAMEASAQLAADAELRAIEALARDGGEE
jgi:hypothetical protein